MAFAEPPVPKIRAFLCTRSSKGSILWVKPTTSLLNPFSMVLLPWCVILTTFTAPIVVASGVTSSR